MNWIASKFCKQWRQATFMARFQKWRSNNFLELRGRKTLSPEIQQAVYEAWLENSINSTDNRNGRAMINLFEKEYQEKFGELLDVIVEVSKSTNKRGRKIVSANRMIMTCTIRLLQQKLVEKGYQKAKSDGEEIDTSISTLFMNNTTCGRSPNGYFSWKCVSDECKDCKKNYSSKHLVCGMPEENV
eukprot:gene10553-11673_t